MPCTNPEDSAPFTQNWTVTANADVSSWNGPVCWTCGARYLGNHVCTGIRQRSQPFPVQPIQLYTIQCCPVCQGKGSHPGGFYGYSGSLNSEECRTCASSGLLKVGLTGTVERVPPLDSPA